jgi:hypothetical protein
LRPKDYISPALFISVFCLYLIYLCPTLFSGDSPLLTVSAFALGPAHPPGYPLYVMLGKALSFIPAGSVAFKLNLLSALSGAAASVLVFKSVKTLTEDDAAAVFAALLAAATPLAWAEATKAEVYTLNAALAMAIFYLGLRFLKDTPDRRLLFAMSFILGIGMGNHHTIGFMVFPLVLAALLRARDKRTLAYSVAFLCAGMSVYLLCHIRSLKFLADGALFAYSDASTFKDFLVTFLREEYHPSTGLVAAPVHDPLSFFRGIYNVARYFLYGNMGIFSVLAVLCIPLLWRRKAELSFIVVSFLSYAAVLSAMVYTFGEPKAYSLFLLDPYMLPALYITSAAAGCGLFFLIRPITRRAPDIQPLLALAVVLLPLVFILPEALRTNDLSRHYLTDDASDNLLESLPPRSIVIADSDSSYFPLAYKNFVEKKRDDVLLLYGDARGVMTQSAPMWSYKALFSDLPATGSFYPVTDDYLYGKQVFAFDVLRLSEDFISRFSIVPFINTYRLIPIEREIDRARAKDEFRQAFGMLVYERALRERASDVYSTELKMSMFVPLAHYAYLLREQGTAALSEKYYEDAIKLVTRKGVAHYMLYLKAGGRKDEAEAFIEALEPYARTYPNIRKLSEELKEEYL